MKVKVHQGRIDFPRKFPFYIGWNKQLSNPQGSTIFIPVVDCTRQYINILLGVLSEPEGQRPLFVDDWRRFRPKSWKDQKAWIGQYLGLGPPIPYQPVGGIDRATDGFVNPDIIIPLGAAHLFDIDNELFFLLQNLMLLGQAMGLGVWGHASIWPAANSSARAGKWLVRPRISGHVVPPRPLTSAPLPASQHNPVGIDGILEGLCPPYVKAMDEAVDTATRREIRTEWNFHGPCIVRPRVSQSEGRRNIPQAAELASSRGRALRERHLQLYL